MIVAQHSFGIPCSIERIVLLAKSRKIFLLEDCALTLGSTVNGKKLGLLVMHLYFLLITASLYLHLPVGSFIQATGRW